MGCDRLWAYLEDINIHRVHLRPDTAQTLSAFETRSRRAQLTSKIPVTLRELVLSAVCII